MSPLPNFPSLTPDERVWRLDWFGECAYPGSVRRYAQPSIKVAISPLRCEPNDAEALLQPGGTDHMHQREVWAPVAVLPLLAIGDLWQGGRLIASPSYHAETFRSVQIVPGTTSFVKAGLAVDEKFLIPLHAHPWHRLHTQAYCVAVSLGGGRRLLIPCVEIIRFYFGSSSNLLQRLFSMPLNAEALWSSKSFDPGSRHMHLVLAPGISGASASDVGRMAGDRLAWRSAAGIHISCQKAAASGQVAYPYTGFPFEGETNLAVTGVWLPFGDEPRATFLAYQLRSCSHAFPFRSLSYETSRRNAQGARRPESSRNATGVRHVSEISLRTKTVDDDPSARKSQHSGGFPTKRRFPDLLRKPVWKEKIESLASAEVFLIRSNGSIEQVAFGEPDGSSDAAGIDLATQPEAGPPMHKKPPLPHFVRKTLARIRRETTANGKKDRTIRVIDPKERAVPVFSLAVAVDEDGEVLPELLFSDEAGRVRQRRACFAEVIECGVALRQLAIIEERNAQSAALVVQVREPSIHQLTQSLLKHLSMIVSAVEKDNGRL